MKGPLATVFPPLRRLPWTGKSYAVSRDEAYLLFIILNELLLGVESTLAHISNGTVKPYEWTPILFGPIAGFALIAAFVANRKGKPWGRNATIVALTGSIIVGVLGTYLHLVRTVRPFAAAATRLTLGAVVWGLPLLAPPAFALAGILGFVTLSARPVEDKTRDYILLSSLGILIAAVSSVIDHLRTGFTNPWLWILTVVGVFATVVALTLALVKTRSRGELTTYVVAMLMMIVTGPLGSVLHFVHDLGVGNTIVIERLLRQAPVLAPMVLANYGLMGLLALMDEEA